MKSKIHELLKKDIMCVSKKLKVVPLLCLSVLVILSSCGNSQSGGGDTKDSASKPADSASGPSVAADWKIGVQLWTFHFVPFVVAIEKADSAGIKYVEAFPGQELGGGMKGKFGTDMTAEEKSKIRQLLQSKGISIVAMGVITPKTIDEWKKYFDLAKEFGLSYITSEPLKDQWNAIDSLAGELN